MVDTVGNIMSGVGAGAVRVAQASSRDGATASAEAGLALNEVQSLSPRMHSDSVSGVLVTEYLSSEGAVSMQIPSAVALAYLRSGLTATGEPRPDGMLAKGAEAVAEGVVA